MSASLQLQFTQQFPRLLVRDNLTELTREGLIADLTTKGFRIGPTASKKWRLALAKSSGSDTMVVLVRARGIDLLITPMSITEMLNPQQRLSVSMHRPGDRFVEYNYTESKTTIHSNVLAVASLFVAQRPIDDSYFQKVGIGRSEWASKYGTKAVAKEQARDEGSLSQMYRDLSNNDGESVYLSDGVWLGPGGSLRDEG